MFFIIDAHLPKIIVEYLEALDCEAIHTSALELGNRTPDEAINELAVSNSGIVITKDADFYNSFLLKREPPKLVMVRGR